MSCWPEVPLHYLVRFGNGQDYEDVEDAEGDVPVIGSGGPFTSASEALYDGESVLFGRKGTIDKPRYENGRFWTVDTMFYTVLGPCVHGRWLYYWATTVPYGLYSTSTALPSMTSAVLGRLRVAVPSLAEQSAIAGFLDRETAKIDALIDKQNEMIGLLHLRRQEAVWAVVTRGLTDAATVPVRTLPWLPELPADWSVCRINYDFEVVLGKMLDAGRQAFGDDIPSPYIRAANIQDGRLDLSDVNTMPFRPSELQRLSLKLGDLLVVEGGASVGTVVHLNVDMPGWSFQKTANRVRSRGCASTRFLAYVLRAFRDRGIISLICDGSTIPHLTAEKLRALGVPKPPYEIQEALADRLDRETEKIDALIAKAEEFVGLAKERRAALITAAVTGRIDVLEKVA